MSEATKIQKATRILLRIGPEGVDLYYGGGGGTSLCLEGTPLL